MMDIDIHTAKIGLLVRKISGIVAAAPKYEVVTTVSTDKLVIGYHWPSSWYEPVPMNYLWLEFFGFRIREKRETGNDWFRQTFNDFKTRECIVFHDNDDQFWFEVNGDAIQVKYVHELQCFYPGQTGGHQLIVSPTMLNDANKGL